jgi:hypothetical protein
MTLVEGGRVRAARLEAASSKLYFECQPPPPAAAAAAAAAMQASTAAGQKSTSSSKQAQQAAAATAAAAGAGSAAAVLPAAAKQPLRKSFYVKLADRHDPVLVGKILTAGAALQLAIADCVCGNSMQFTTVFPACSAACYRRLFCLRGSKVCSTSVGENMHAKSLRGSRVHACISNWSLASTSKGGL